MKKYALVGKNIQHSLSPQIYKKLMSDDFIYDLIDVEEIDELPALEELKKKYSGVNITSPYKEYYFERVLCVDVPLRVSAVNCISFAGNKVRMTNTDYPALRKILTSSVLINYRIDKICILGDGVMSQLVQELMTSMHLSFFILSRKNNGDLNEYDYSQLISKGDEFTLLINTCSRSFNFSALVNKQTIFWDMNYAMDHKDWLLSQCQYVDGYDLLYEQATEAVRFWSEAG